jgi:hypothetical protein
VTARRINPSSPIASPASSPSAAKKSVLSLFEFFTANIRNPRTRRAYARAAGEFFD